MWPAALRTSPARVEDSCIRDVQSQHPCKAALQLTGGQGGKSLWTPERKHNAPMHKNFHMQPRQDEQTITIVAP